MPTLSECKRGLISKIIRLWLRSLRIRFSQDIPSQCIFALWHRDLPACMAAFADLGILVMISHSPDGDLAANIARDFGYRVVRGSDHRGYESLRHLLHALRQGQRVGMTLDGPRGPSGKRKPGVHWLQMHSAAPLYLLRVRYKAAWRLPTWDKMYLPLPFSQILVSLRYESAR